MSSQISPVRTTLLAGAAGLAAAALVAIMSLTLAPREAAASPKFAASTGKPCAFCHSNPPALNTQGKEFKAKGNKL
jgi:hypothetical protein